MLAKRGDKSLVHYQGFGNSYDEWVSADRIKLRGAPAPAHSRPAGAAAATGFEGLFYRQVIVPKDPAVSGGQSLKTYPYWFLADGNVLGGSWGALVDYLDDGGLEAYKKSQARFWGTYSITDGEIVITWTGGREQRFPLEGSPQGVKPKGLLRTYPVKRGLKLDGKYMGLEGGLGKGVEAAATFTYVFRPDMTLTYEKDGTATFVVRGLEGSEVDRDVVRIGGRMQGSYEIDGYRMTIKNAESINILPLWVFNEEDAQSDAPKMICLGGDAYRRQE